MVIVATGGTAPHASCAFSDKRTVGLEDVTPLRDPGLHFLRHEGSEQEFLALAKSHAQHIHGLDFTLAVPPRMEDWP